MAPGEGDTWHARCHTHKLHLIYVEGGEHGGVGGVVGGLVGGKSQRGRRLCVERSRTERLLDKFIGGEEQKRKERK